MPVLQCFCLVCHYLLFQCQFFLSFVHFMKCESQCLFFHLQKLAAECVSSRFSGTLIPYKCDLSVEDDMLSMFSWIKVQHQGVDVCINNAGLALPEPLLSGKTSGWRTMMDVCTSLDKYVFLFWKHAARDCVMVVLFIFCRCMSLACQCAPERLTSPWKKEKLMMVISLILMGTCVIEHFIHILLLPVPCTRQFSISKYLTFSMCGHRVLHNADLHFYTATKYAVTALTEGLRQELREAKTHIRATVREWIWLFKINVSKHLLALCVLSLTGYISWLSGDGVNQPAL